MRAAEPGPDQVVTFEQGLEERRALLRTLPHGDRAELGVVRAVPAPAEPRLPRQVRIERGGQRSLGLLDEPGPRLLDLQAAALERLVKVGQRLGQRLARIAGRPRLRWARPVRNCSIACRRAGKTASVCSWRPRVLLVWSFSSCRSAVNSSTRRYRPTSRSSPSAADRIGRRRRRSRPRCGPPRATAGTVTGGFPCRSTRS